MILKNSSIELIKWLAVIAMTCDHINKYLFNGTLPYLFEIGRLALPLFVFVMAFNLARPGSLEKKTYTRIAARLALFGVIASVPYIALGGVQYGWWPLNVLFTLLVLSAVIFSLFQGGIAGYLVALSIFIAGGALVEYCWIALALGASIWVALRYKSLVAAVVAVAFCAALAHINQNYWALMAVPVIALSSFFKIDLPRLKYFFYIYYPAHLVILLLIRVPMEKAGYFFIGT